jgi:hypothetical protein
VGICYDVLTGVGWRLPRASIPVHSDKAVPLRTVTFTRQSKITLLASLCFILMVILLVGLSLYQSNVTSAPIKVSSNRVLAADTQQSSQAEGRMLALKV